MSTSKPSDDSSDRRSRILDAALEVFANEGFRAAEVKTVAEKAGVGKATIYKFFKSKEDLLLVLVDENLSHIRDLAIKSLIGPGTPMDKLESAVRAMANFIESNRQFSRVLIQEAGDFMGEIQGKHLDMVESNLPVAEAFFSTFPEDSKLRQVPTKFIMQLLVNMLIGSLYTWALNDRTYNTPMADSAIASLRVLIAGLESDVELPISLNNSKEEIAEMKGNMA